MPATVEVSLGELIDEAYDALYRSAERPFQVVVGSDALDDAAETSFTLASGSLDVTDRVESPTGEIMLVTAKSVDATPVYTVSRGYQSTSDRASNWPTGTVLLKNPTFERVTVTRWLERAISSLMNTELPFVETKTYPRHSTFQYIELPSDAIDVLRVRHFGILDGRIAEVGGWAFEEVPTEVVASGKALRVSSGVTEADELIVDVRRPYTFSGVGEEATVPLPIAARDIPVLWAAAYGQSRREISRAELDKIEEWNQEQAIRAGVNLRMIRDMWGEVYRRVDEAKRVHRLPRQRPYRKMAKAW